MPEPATMANPGHAKKHVVVAGVGLITPLAEGSVPTFVSLLDGRVIWDVGREGPSEPLPLVRKVGKVGGADCHDPPEPAAMMAESAAREACRDAGVDPRGLPLVLGSSKGEVEALVQRRAEAVAMGPHGHLASTLQARLQSGPLRMVVAACASGLVALDRGYRWLLDRRHSQPDEVLVVATDASLAEPFVHSYRRLGVLAPLVPGRYQQHPLSCRRHGFVLAESAAAVVLRAVDDPSDLIQIEATSVLSESHDIVRLPLVPQALARCARLLMAGRSVSMLHPHAAGTQQDERELACYLPFMGGDAGIYACKGALGHSLGAAGLVAFVVACLCARTGRRPPMPWLNQPIESVRHLLDGGGSSPISRHAVFASGFGGHTAGVLIKKKMADGGKKHCGQG